MPSIRTVRPPGEARERRRKAAEQRRPPEIDRRQEPTIGPLLEDTASLEMVRDSVENDDPYATHAWHLDPREGVRRAADLEAVNRDRSAGDVDNPYDKSKGRKGW